MILPVTSLNSNKTYKRRGVGFKSSTLLSNKNISSTYKSLDKNSADYIKYIYGRLRGECNQAMKVNVETGKLQDIVASEKPHIFIMNHTSNQFKDIKAAQFFNALLYREYIYNSKAKDCPRSKILANTRILKKAKDGGEELKWMGVIPIPVGLKKKTKAHQSAPTLQKIANEIIHGKTNLFIFPEGALCGLTFLPLQYKFQAGVSVIIKKVLEVINNIKVIPLSFAHNRKESAIHIGDTVTFSKENNQYHTNRGNVNSPFFDENFAKLWGDKNDIVITNNGIPVEENDIVPFISGILVKNLETCTKEAKKDLKKKDDQIYKL